ncbi:hypothetical protein HK097_005474 [Rhizophlyctis rosea]|uniref:BTB domain-containing protein n=1 Tax=Rhizophlyctis rosea TaxID=64517 RepID=A0AAD5X638_9FUNG|nr:hypothetical protein HK097_005474 [Rhizophlyctis rosea]
MVSPAPFSEYGGDNQSFAGQPQQLSHNDQLCVHLFEMGFRNAMYADMIIRFHVIPEAHASPDAVALDGFQLKLHRILAVRSPYFARLLDQVELNTEPYQQQIPIVIPIQIQDPNITPEGLLIAAGSLYGSFQLPAIYPRPDDIPSIRAARLRATLAAANLFQIHDLVAAITDQIKNHISSVTVIDYCRFVSQDWGANYATADEIKAAVREYLLKGVGRELGGVVPVWANKEGDGYRELVRLFSDLPYEWLKRIVESKAFEVPTDMERFSFAKEIVQIRSTRNKGSQSSLLAGEENVLLNFGKKSGGSAVTIIRKPPKGSTVNGMVGAGVGGIGDESGYSTDRRVWKAGPNP